MEPLISVIIPAHNSSKTIKRAILSILEQTYKNLEIIVVDDNSSDNTKEIVSEIIKENKNVYYYSLPYNDPNRFNDSGRNINAGYSARNYGLEKIRGEWITLQDADDISLPNRIEVEYKLANKYNSNHVVIDWIKFDEKYYSKKLDVEKFLKENPNSVLDKNEVLNITKKTKGFLMSVLGKSHKFIPFKIKQLPIMSRLFFGPLLPYPCAGNSPLFRKEVLEKVKFRKRDERVWPSYVGRGADRDFNFQISETFKNSYAFKIPLYMWNQKSDNPQYKNLDNYLI